MIKKVKRTLTLMCKCRKSIVMVIPLKGDLEFMVIGKCHKCNKNFVGEINY